MQNMDNKLLDSVPKGDSYQFYKQLLGENKEFLYF